MKKSTILIGILFPIWVNAGMHISTNERVSAMLKPDVLRGSLSFEEQGKDANAIKGHLNEIVAEVKRIDPNGRYCRGGGYHISPRYSYKEQRSEFIGYSGNLSFSCEFPNIDRYNDVSAAIDKVSASGIRKNQGALEWGVSAAWERETQNRLRLEMLRQSESQAKAFSKETGMVCEAVSVNFAGAPRVMPMMAKGMMASVSTESPLRSDEELVVEAAVDYNCSKRVP